MDYKRVLTIQDISCVGQCSLTVALPILSACGVETCVLPSAVLSTHTGGFNGPTFRDLTDDMPQISQHWKQEGITFAAISSGYLGSIRQIEYVRSIFRENADDGCVKVVDPAMADHGKLYKGFDQAFVEAMKGLCREADYVIPNITESCLMTGIEYKTAYDRAYIDEHLQALTALGCKNVILTGISYTPDTTGIVVYENGQYAYYCHARLPNSCHGTGDIFASAFVGALMRGCGAYRASQVAADFALACIRKTAELPGHWYGAAFEPVLGKLIEMLQ